MADPVRGFLRGRHAFLLMVLIAVAAVACSDSSPVVPDVKGVRLDEAKRALQTSGIKDEKTDVDGGAFADVGDAQNWWVCSVEPAPGTKSDKVDLKVKKSGDGCGPFTAFKMPDVQCHKLNEAKKTLAGTEGAGNVEIRDATGDGRAQLVDSNWIVLTQAPPPGDQAAGTKVTLEVAKEGERTCPPGATTTASTTPPDQTTEPPTTAAPTTTEPPTTEPPTTAPPTTVPPPPPTEPPTTVPPPPTTIPPTIPPVTTGAYYPNCAAAKAAGAAPLHRGQPGYREDLDRDGDGVACEK